MGTFWVLSSATPVGHGLNFRLPAAFNLESESDDSMCWNLPAEDLSDGT
jgi:hypothetical protein